MRISEHNSAICTRSALPLAIPVPSRQSTNGSRYAIFHYNDIPRHVQCIVQYVVVKSRRRDVHPSEFFGRQ
jgi:hypothetical protein